MVTDGFHHVRELRIFSEYVMSRIGKSRKKGREIKRRSSIVKVFIHVF